MKSSRFVWVAAIVAVFLAILVLLQVDPQETDLLPKCAFRQWTGLHCPGCGATRALHAALHGRFFDAIRFNPLLILGGPIIAALIWRRKKRELQGQPVQARFVWTLFAILVGYWVLRNVPSPENGLLAPQRAALVERVTE